MHMIGSTPAATAMIGDQVMTDIIAGNRAGLHTIWVERIAEHEFVLTRQIHRRIERFVAKRMGFWPQRTEEESPDET